MKDANELTDEILTAYCDGELSPSQTVDVERRLAGDPDARERLRRLRQSTEMTRQAYYERYAEPVPAALLETIHNAPDPVSDGRPSGVKSGPWARLKRWMEEPLADFLPAPAWAPALALVFAVGLGIGQIGLLNGSDPQGERFAELGPVDRQSGLHVALETVGSGRGLPLGEKVFTSFVSFEDATGRFCREFELVDREGHVDLLVGVACRAPAATWEIEFSTVGHAVASVDDSLYAPASARIHETVDAFVESLMVSGPLSKDDELALIENGWQKTAP